VAGSINGEWYSELWESSNLFKGSMFPISSLRLLNMRIEETILAFMLFMILSVITLITSSLSF